jgi:adenylosuccinate synthase
VDFYQHFGRYAQIVDEDHLARLLRQTDQTVFEGAQGVLLDEWYGFHPYTTWSTTTFANADELLTEAGYSDEVTKLGLLRAYAVRHGPGPFVTEDADLAQALPEPHNPTNPWQREFRIGHFDAVAARYALSVTGPVDGLVITCLDRLYGLADVRICTGYHRRRSGFILSHLKRAKAPDLDFQQRLTDDLLNMRPMYDPRWYGTFTPRRVSAYLKRIEEELGYPVVLASTGPTALDKRVVGA